MGMHTAPLQRLRLPNRAPTFGLFGLAQLGAKLAVRPLVH